MLGKTNKQDLAELKLLSFLTAWVNGEEADQYWSNLLEGKAATHFKYWEAIAKL